jgi:hypothetical protein
MCKESVIKPTTERTGFWMKFSNSAMRTHSAKVSRLLIYGLALAGLALHAMPVALASSPCEPVQASSFDFLKQPPFVKTGWTVQTNGIDNSCQVALVKACLFRILITSVRRAYGPPFPERWVQDGWVSPSAFEQMRGDRTIDIPLREDHEKYPVGNSVEFPNGNRVGYSRILKWQFVGNTDITVDLAYQDRTNVPAYVQRVRFKTNDGKNWFLDEVLK